MPGRAMLRAAIPGPQAVQELHVYLRTMSVAQRRWARQIALQENEVRRLMILEDHHRERLRQSALRHLNARLQHLANTDLATAAALAAPPVSAPHLLQTCGVGAGQVTAFSMYALARLAADPDCLDTCTRTDLTRVIADLQSGWEVVAPTKKAAYTELADTVRARLSGGTLPIAAVEAPPARVAQSAPRRPTRTRTRTRTHTRRTPAAPAQAPSAASPACGAGARRREGESWEAAAFRVFYQEARTLFARALGCAGAESVPETQWTPIAQAEWATKTLREKRLYYLQTRES